jgi:hypothetical protein
MDQTLPPGAALLTLRKAKKVLSNRMNSFSTQHGALKMKIFIKPITSKLYKVWLRSRLDVCSRDLQAIAAQRENDFHAERILHREMSEMRSKLQSL